MIIIFASFLIFLLLTGSNSLIIWGSDSVKTSMQALFNCEARGKVDGLNCSRDEMTLVQSSIRSSLRFSLQSVN